MEFPRYSHCQPSDDKIQVQVSFHSFQRIVFRCMYRQTKFQRQGILSKVKVNALNQVVEQVKLSWEIMRKITNSHFDILP